MYYAIACAVWSRKRVYSLFIELFLCINSRKIPLIPNLHLCIMWRLFEHLKTHREWILKHFLWQHSEKHTTIIKARTGNWEEFLLWGSGYVQTAAVSASQLGYGKESMQVSMKLHTLLFTMDRKLFSSCSERKVFKVP